MEKNKKGYLVDKKIAGNITSLKKCDLQITIIQPKEGPNTGLLDTKNMQLPNYKNVNLLINKTKASFYWQNNWHWIIYLIRYLGRHGILCNEMDYRTAIDLLIEKNKTSKYATKMGKNEWSIKNIVIFYYQVKFKSSMLISSFGTTRRPSFIKNKE